MTRTLVLLAVLLAAGCRKASTVEQVAAAVPSAPAQSAVKPVPKDLPPVVARVNGEPIERWELESAVREIETLSMHPLISAERDETMRAIVDRLIGHHLAAQEARAETLGASAAEVQASMDQAEHEFSNKDDFAKMLEDLKMSVEQFRHQTQIRLELSKFIRAKIAPAIKIDQKAVAAYYSQNLPRFQQPETVRTSHIFISVPPGSSPAQREAGRAKAAAVLGQLRGGVDFAVLARSQSEDPGSAEAGGDIGTIARGQSEPSFEIAAFALQPGQLSDVVETSLGFHVIKGSEHHQATTSSLDQVRSEIEQLIVQEKQNERFSTFIEGAKAKGRIEVLF